MDTDTSAFSDEGPDENHGDVQPRKLYHLLQLLGFHVLGYLIKKAGGVTGRLPEYWSVRRTIILATIFLVFYQLCTMLLHALQVDHIIV